MRFIIRSRTKKEADPRRKMGPTTETTDHHHHHHYHLHDNGDNCDEAYCCLHLGRDDDDIRMGSSMTCPLRPGINNNKDDVDNDNRYFSCDSDCPNICSRGICASSSPSCVITSNFISSTTAADSPTSSRASSTGRKGSSCCSDDISCCSNTTKNNSFNDNNCVSPSRITRCRRMDRSRSSSIVSPSRSNNSISSKCNSDDGRRISRSSSNFLTRPCALYLLISLVILDLSDFNSGILITSSANRRTDSSSSGSVDIDNVVSLMGKRHNGFLVNGAFDNQNGHGLGGLTGEIPLLSMDSVFFDDSIGNRLTGFSQDGEDSTEQQEGENTSSEEEDNVEISRTVEPQMLKRLESQFLNLFGMTKRPERAEKKQIKIPKYLLDLYQKQSGTELPTTNLNLPGRHTRTANTVRTFYHQPGNPKAVSYPWKGRENHINFNLASIPSMEKVTGAELRVPFTITVESDHSAIVNSVGGESNKVLEGNDVDGKGLKAVRILIHDVMKPATSPMSKKPKETHLLEPISYPIDSKSVVLSKRRNGTSTFWLTFDVFPAVARWMSNPKRNHGLVLEILGVTNEGHIVPQETVVQRHNLRVKRDVLGEIERSGVSGSGGSSTSSNSIITPDSSSSPSSAKRSSSKSTQDSGESLSSSVGETPASSAVVSSPSSPSEVGVASDDGFISPNEIHGRKKGSTDTSSAIVLFTYSDDGHNPMKTRDAKTLSRHYRSAQAQKRRKNHRNKNRKRNLCQRHAMFVDFQDVGWNDWIVAPPGYAAYYCSGECPFPMAEHLNATNHAVIQALVHSMNPALVPPPCCVPTKYSSLSRLYTDSSDKIVLKNYNEMVVDSCGCS